MKTSIPRACSKGRGAAARLLWFVGLLYACSPAAPPVVPATLPPATETATPTPAPAPTATATLTPNASPTPDCAEPAGQLGEGAYPGAVLREPVPLLVYLPPCYDTSGRTYPALYLLHGKPYNETHWPSLGVVESADKAISAGTWPAFLIVMPRVPEPLFSSTDGGPGSYEDELVAGLIPYVDANYRTMPVAEGRALAGISRGGVWALEVGLRHPDAFDRLGALSPSLAVNYPRPAYDPFVILDQAGAFPSWLLLLAGDADWARPETERLSRALDAHLVLHNLTIVPGDHSDGTWRASVTDVVAFLTAGWPPEPAP